MTLQKRELTAEICRKLLTYDPESGYLTWKLRDPSFFKTVGLARRWNREHAGELAFQGDNNGYLCGHILKISCKSHRIIWLLMTGNWPEGDIDHINGNRSDNSWSNLRDVTRKDNLRNTRARTSNPIGIYFNKNAGKWHAQITADHQRFHLGYFDNLDDAKSARKAAEKKFGFHPNHGRTPKGKIKSRGFQKRKKG